MTTDEAVPIPQPTPSFLVGNVRDIDPADAPASFKHLAEIYGEIFQLDIAGRKTIVCSSYDTINDLCDAERFEKPIMGSLKEVRHLTGDGLFTSYPGEKAWGIAHRLLMPVFGPLGIRKMFDPMMDCSSQMILRWDRFGPSNEIVCADDFTRLTFDMIGLCAFGYRFNNFYSPTMHPFVSQMADVLLECGRRSNRLSIENNMRVFSTAKLNSDIVKMHALCDEIIVDRIANPQPDAKDLLNPMLNGTDPETGEKMTHESVRYNMVTFLVAGHETTSGTLGFLFYHQGKYEVDPEAQILMNLHGLHHDRKIWGDDADVFKPERFLNGQWEKLPKNAWKPFDDGSRACIGRDFATQEMIMVVALILQKFQVELADPACELHVKVTLTMKPDDLRLKVRRRPGRTMESLGVGGVSAPQSVDPDDSKKHDEAGATSGVNGAKPLTILYGSQAGTCKALAEELHTNAARYGFEASVATLDSATEHMPNDHPLVIIEPSYEGKPADNAKKFVSWLQTNEQEKLLEGVQYALFGVGNSDWSATFHRVPKLTDELLSKMGAKRFIDTGFVDVKLDIVGPWESWTEKIWSTLRKLNGNTAAVTDEKLKATICPPRFASHLGSTEISYGLVKANVELGGDEVGLPKKQIDIELPPGTSYRTGDYMTVLPLNNRTTVRRVLKRFNLSPDDNITISGTSKMFLETEGPISVFDLLMTRVELGTPISRKQLQSLVDVISEGQRSKISDLLCGDSYEVRVLPKRYSILDILDEHTACQLPFEDYLDMLKPLTPRQYSISSSPIANIEYFSEEQSTTQRLTASLTYDVHDEPAWSNANRRFQGVASTYLSHLDVGDRVRCFTRSTNANFHLPSDPLIPVIMVCAGTGIAPMRGFIQERATIRRARNITLGPAVLYFGCRDHEKDFIYKDELAQWESDGVVNVRPCFSREGPQGHFKYVPDRMWADRDELSDLFKAQEAKILVCGSASKLGKSTADVCKKIWLEKNSGKTDEDAQIWLEKVKEHRYVSDTFE